LRARITSYRLKQSEDTPAPWTAAPQPLARALGSLLGGAHTPVGSDERRSDAEVPALDGTHLEFPVQLPTEESLSHAGIVQPLLWWVRSRLDTSGRDERGMTTETVVHVGEHIRMRGWGALTGHPPADTRHAVSTRDHHCGGQPSHSPPADRGVLGTRPPPHIGTPVTWFLHASPLHAPGRSTADMDIPPERRVTAGCGHNGAVLRCTTCGASVSEWAARCPDCGTSAADAISIPVPMSRFPRRPRPQGGGRWPRISLRVRVVAVGVLVGIGLLVGMASHRNHHRPGEPRASAPPPPTPSTSAVAPAPPPPTPSTSAVAPAPPTAPPSSSAVALAALRDYTLLYASQSGPRLLALDGSQPSIVMPTGPGDLERPLRVAGGVVFVHQAIAYFLATPIHGPPRALIAADHLFPAIPGQVGVQRGLGPEPVTVQFLSIPPGTGAISPLWQLPAGYQAVAQSAGGILVDDMSGELRTLSLASGQLGPILGQAATVIDTHLDTVAWRASVGCDSGECPLHITDATTGADRVVAPPPGHHGFFDGGAFSPDGTQLAAFVSAPPTTSPRSELVIIDVASSIIHPVTNGEIQIGEPGGAAVWTPDATTVIFSGNNGPMLAYRPADTQVLVTNVPASYSFVVW
jgi:hypothetical protein